MKKTQSLILMLTTTFTLLGMMLFEPLTVRAEASSMHHENITTMSVGASGVVYAVAESGNVYAWGVNGNYYPFLNATESSSTIYRSPKLLNDLINPTLQANEKIIEINVSSYSGVVAITNNGRVLYWGNNTNYEIGPVLKTGQDRATISVYPAFTGAPTGFKPRYAVSNYDATIILGEDRRTVYAIGNGPSVGNGIAITVDSSTPAYTQKTPVNISSRFALATGETIVSLESANDGFIVVTSLGRVLAWGYNNSIFGYLGFPTTSDPNVPTAVPLPTLNSGEIVVKATTSGALTSILTSQGRVFNHGFHNVGQLGIGVITLPNNRSDSFRLVPKFSSGGIKDIATGRTHNVALSTDHVVYTTGRDNAFQQGNGTLDTNVFEYATINANFKFPGAPNLRNIFSAMDSSYLVNSDGKVYSWGPNTGGLLGIDSTETTIDFPVPLFSATAAYVESLIKALPNPVTLADKTKITEARTAYNNLGPSDKALILNYDLLLEAEVVIVELSIGALPTVSALTLNDESSITAARTLFDALTASQKLNVDNAQTLTALETKLQELKERAAALVVDNQILAIAQPLSLAQKAEVQAARTAYNALTTAQKSYVAQLPLLETLESTLVDLENQAAATTVSNLIGALPSPIALTDQTAVEAARAAYDALTSTQQALVLNEAVLTAAEAALVLLTNQVAANATIALITFLPNPITLEDEAAVVAARASYDALTSDQKALVTNLTILTSAEATIISLKNEAAADVVIDLIDNLPSPITLDDQDATEAARAAYDALTSSQQALVDNLSALTSAETAIVGLLSEVADVIALINNLPDPLDVDDQAAVEAARDAFDALTTTSQDYVTNAEDLLAAEALLNDLFEAVDVTINAITDLPDLEDLTLEDGESLRAARAYYDALSPAQQALITNLSSLEALEVRYLELLAIQAIEDRIDELPSLEDVTLEDEAAILEVYEDYLALSTTNQNEVENRQDLFDLLQRLEVLNVTSDVTSFPDVEGFDDLLNDRDTREETIASLLELWDRYQNLTEEEKALLDPESRAQLEALYAHYLKATNPMNTVWFISILMLHLAAAGYFVYTNRKQFLKKA